jgi:hypothetical protein
MTTDKTNPATHTGPILAPEKAYAALGIETRAEIELPVALLLISLRYVSVTLVTYIRHSR